MNFLAHLHIADTCKSDLTGNLLGDFVKGDPYKQYPKEIAEGIKLHRFVDSYTDSHKVMKQAKAYFPSELRRFAPIALDMLWDHCLASHWDKYHHQDLSSFCLRAENTTRATKVSLPEAYIRVTDRMWRRHWLESYQDFETLEVALERMSTRSPRMVKLASCFITLDEYYSELTGLFPELYKDLLNACSEFVTRR